MSRTNIPLEICLHENTIKISIPFETQCFDCGFSFFDSSYVKNKGLCPDEKPHESHEIAMWSSAQLTATYICVGTKRSRGSEVAVVSAAVEWYEIVEEIKKTGRSARLQDMKDSLDRLHAEVKKLKGDV